jgi:DoxX-like family
VTFDYPVEGEIQMAINVLLWVVQGLLAALFLFAGGMKLVLPLEALAGPIALPGLFMRFIGVAEVAGAVGLVLPSLLRIQPRLTPVAAAGLVIIMIGATVLTGIAGPVAMAAMPGVVGILAGVVTYGRMRTSPIPPRPRVPATPRVSVAA